MNQVAFGAPIGTCRRCKRPSYLKGPRGTTTHPACDWRSQIDPRPENDSRALAVQFVRTLLGGEVVGEIVASRRSVLARTTSPVAGGLCVVCGSVAVLRTADGRWAHPACGVTATQYDLRALYGLRGDLDPPYPEFVGLRLPGAAGRADVVEGVGVALERLRGGLPVLVKAGGSYWSTRWRVRGGVDVIYDVRRVLGPGTVTVRRSG